MFAEYFRFLPNIRNQSMSLVLCYFKYFMLLFWFCKKGASNGGASDMTGQRRTPVNMKMNENGLNASSSNADSQKIKNFLEKIMPSGAAAQSGFSQDMFNQQQQQQAPSSSNNPVSMLAMLQQQQQVNVNSLPKLPPAKVSASGLYFRI